MSKNNKLNLDELSTAVDNSTDIVINKKNVINANELIIIKRDGREELFDSNKLRKVCMWACDNKEYMADELIRDTEIKLHKKIHIADMYQQLIVTAVNKISMLQPIWEKVSANLELMKIYKETYNITKTNEYPELSEVLKKGVKRKIYDKNVVNSYTPEEIEILNGYIKPERDHIFNYKSLVTFFNKYCLKYTDKSRLELPQHVYMRVAMTLMVNEKGYHERLKLIKDEYDQLSQHFYTRATPIMLNAMTPGQQLSSCVLNTLNDDSESILDTAKNLGIYSKYKGGTALDITSMRAAGSYIEGTQGYSSGPTPFAKVFESVMKAWNQGGTRPGSLCVYFPWWHYNVFDILSLKSNGGTDENRARGLKYAIKLNQNFIEAFINDEEVYLFDPKDVTNMIGTFGGEFEDIYNKNTLKTNIRKHKVSARELMYKIMKERTETGNIYLYHEDNVNEQTLLKRYIGSSNLCCEITLPSVASELIDNQLLRLEDGTAEIVKRYKAGEIALCNLSSFNLERWFYMSQEEKQICVDTIVRGLDNTVDIANYPVKEGKYSNLLYRFLGIGVMNYTNYLALKEIVIDTIEAEEETAKLFDEISYMVINSSVDLAIEKGKFERFYDTDWAEGKLPIHKANKNALKLLDRFEWNVDWDKWEKLSERVRKYGIRNAQLLAIAPTATSGKAVNAIESIEPISNFLYKEEGTFTVTTLVPNFQKNNRFYKKAVDCSQYALLRNAAIRQIYLDQSQSVNLNIKRPDSLYELSKLHIYGFSYGMKTFYYFKQEKDIEEECESCT